MYIQYYRVCVNKDSVYSLIVVETCDCEPLTQLISCTL